ncbi:MAG: hypothetical protein OHK0045_08930 [Raineya sp.]
MSIHQCNIVIRFILLFVFAFYCQGYGQNKKKLIEESLKILQKYDPQGYAIVESVPRKPVKYNLCGSTITFSSSGSVEEYLSENSLEKMVEELPTLVHEFNHTYTSNAYPHLIKNNICDDNDYNVYWLETNNTILVKLDKTFPSKRIYEYIRKNKLNTFRTETYINGTSSTQNEGVFGLLDEYNSYRLGAMCYLNLFQYYQDTKGDPKDWLMFYLGHTQSSMLSYFEFKFFILQYLIYAQENEKKSYESIMANQAFCQAFVWIDTSFQQIIETYIALYKKIISEEKESFSSALTLEQAEDYKTLTKELQKPQYHSMMELLRSKAR